MTTPSMASLARRIRAYLGTQGGRRVAQPAFLLASVGLLLGLLEFAASFFVELPSSATIRDARLNHTWPPNTFAEHAEWIADNPDFPEPYIHHYNAQAWIETYDVSIPKPQGTYRIFYVGDSFIEGCGPMQDSVPSLVERYLNEHVGSGPTRFEVVNTGTSSYSPVLYYILIRYFIQSYAPDAIVVAVDMTDVFDDWKCRETLVVDSDGNPYAAPPRDLYRSPYVDTLQGAVKASSGARLALYLTEHSYLYNLLEGIRRGQPPDSADSNAEDAQVLMPRWGWCQYERNDTTEKAVAFTLDMVGRIARYCREHGIQLLLTAVPHHQQYEAVASGRPRWSIRPHEDIRRVAEENGAAYLDSYRSLAPWLMGSRQAEYYYSGNMHFSPRGNRLWAQAHIRAFLDPANRLLPEAALGGSGLTPPAGARQRPPR